MKKLLTSLLIVLLSLPVFSQTGSPPSKVFQIHSEKRPFVKKDRRERRKGRHHHRQRKMNDRAHFRENHKR